MDGAIYGYSQKDFQDFVAKSVLQKKVFLEIS